MASFTDRNFPLSMDQGDTEIFTFEYTDDNGTAIDLTGYTGTMKIFWGAAKTPITGILTSPEGSVTLTSATGDLNIGKLVFTLSAAASADIPPSGQSYSNQQVAYVVKITSGGGAVTTLLAGPMTVNPNWSA